MSIQGKGSIRARAGLLWLALAAAPAFAASPGVVVPEALAEPLACDRLEAALTQPAGAWRPLPALDRSVVPRGEGIWLRLPAGDPADSGAWTFAAPSNRTPVLHWFEEPTGRSGRFDAAAPRARQLSFRHVGLELRPRRSGATYLCFEAHRLGLDELAVAPAAEFRAADISATEWRAAAFGIILAMSLFSASFYLALRELVFVRYFGYLAAFVLYLATETGAAHRLPLLDALSVAAMTRLSGMAIDLASGLAMLFALEFTQIRRRVPALARPLRTIGTILLPLAAAHGGAYLLGSATLVQATIALSNLLVAGGGLLLLVAATISAARGDRYSRFFLAGWTPLVVVAFVASAQQLVLDFTRAGTLDAMLGAGAFESVVLAVGLADRTLTYRRELDRARELADRDALSGLLNRRALMRLSDALDAEGERRHRPLALVLFDLDRFKAINDERGHAVGDSCIRAFAEHLSAEARREDLAARVGGEEFVVALPGESAKSAAALAERVRLRVERDGAVHDGERVSLTVSAGVAAGAASVGFDRLLERADRALYRAKDAGRNRVAVDGEETST